MQCTEASQVDNYQAVSCVTLQLRITIPTRQICVIFVYLGTQTR